MDWKSEPEKWRRRVAVEQELDPPGEGKKRWRVALPRDRQVGFSAIYRFSLARHD